MSERLNGCYDFAQIGLTGSILLRTVDQICHTFNPYLSFSNLFFCYFGFVCDKNMQFKHLGCDKMGLKPGKELPSYELKIETFKVRLIEAIGNESVRAFALRAGIAPSVMRRYVEGDTVPGLQAAAKIARLAGVSLDWLAFGDEIELTLNNSLSSEVRTDYVAAQGRVFRCPLHRPTGSGQRKLSEFETIVFSQEWLESQGIGVENLALMRSYGDCMSPTIPRDGVVLVDCQKHLSMSDGIQALMMGEEYPLIRRVQRDPDGGAWLLCDNDAYQPRRLTSAEVECVTTIGRVIWIAGQP